MKKILIIVLVYVLMLITFCGIAYLIGSFVQADFNPALWTKDSREVFAICASLICALLTCLFIAALNALINE